jgi:hypothetical protein
MISKRLTGNIDKETRTPLEPEQGHDTTKPNILPEHPRNLHTSVQKLLSTLVRDGRDESSRLSDETELLHPLVVHRDNRGLNLPLGNDGPTTDEVLIGFLEGTKELLKEIGDNEPLIALFFASAVSSWPYCRRD